MTALDGWGEADHREDRKTRERRVRELVTSGDELARGLWEMVGRLDGLIHDLQQDGGGDGT